MHATNRIKLLTAALAAGWIGVFAEAAQLTPWRPHLAVHITLVGLLIAGTVVAVVAALVYGPASLRAWDAGRAVGQEAARHRRDRAEVAD